MKSVPLEVATRIEIKKKSPTALLLFDTLVWILKVANKSSFENYPYPDDHSMRTTFCSLSISECSGQISRKTVDSTYPINSFKDEILSKSECQFSPKDLQRSSGGPKDRQAEPHTHMRKKKKPINEFSYGYHG